MNRKNNKDAAGNSVPIIRGTSRNTKIVKNEREEKGKKTPASAEDKDEVRENICMVLPLMKLMRLGSVFQYC